MSNSGYLRWPKWIEEKALGLVAAQELAQAESISCRRCSGGDGMLCDQCGLEVVAAALDTVRETNWPEPPEIETAP